MNTISKRELGTFADLHNYKYKLHMLSWGGGWAWAWGAGELGLGGGGWNLVGRGGLVCTWAGVGGGGVCVVCDKYMYVCGVCCY